MNKILFILVITVIFCYCSNEPTYKESLIKADSLCIEYLTTNSSDEFFSIHLYGTLSNNGCSGYSHYKTYWQNQDFIIEAWKWTKADAMNCPTVMVYFDEKIIFYRDSFPEDFNIKVKQPDGSYLEQNITGFTGQPCSFGQDMLLQKSNMAKPQVLNCG